LSELETRLDDLKGIRRDADHLREGLGLLGVKPCCWCGRFFRASDAGVLCDCGDLVCYGCIHEWWPHRSAELGVKDREIVEHKLSRWLLTYHHADVIRQPAKLPEDRLQDLRILATCWECHGAGTLEGSRCRHCDGRGNVWLVVMKRDSQQ